MYQKHKVLIKKAAQQKGWTQTLFFTFLHSHRYPDCVISSSFDNSTKKHLVTKWIYFLPFEWKKCIFLSFFCETDFASIFFVCLCLLNRLAAVWAIPFFQSWRPTSEHDKDPLVVFWVRFNLFPALISDWQIKVLTFRSDPGLFVYCCDFSSTAVELVKVRWWEHDVFKTCIVSGVLG